jgi:hypothetical protein
MTQDLRRETFIALRARHQAYRVASDMLYEEPIDVTVVFCRSCGISLDWRSDPCAESLTCANCGTATPLPTHLRTVAIPVAGLTYYPQFEEGDMLGYEPGVKWVEPEVEQTTPRWMWEFIGFMLAVLIVGAVFAIRYARN